MPKLDQTNHRVQLSPCRTGRIPLSSATGTRAANVAGTMRLWSNNRQVYQMPCHPPSLMGLSNANEFKYYPIFRLPDRAESTHYPLALSVLPWRQYVSDEHTSSITWYPDYVPGTPGTGVTVLGGGPGYVSPSVDYGDAVITPDEDMRNYAMSAPSASNHPSDVGGYTCGLLETNNILPAALAIAVTAPTGSPTDTDWRVPPWSCGYGQPLRAYDGGTELPGLGKLLRHTTVVDSSEERVTTAVKSPLFAWGHHHGLWVGQGASAHNIFGASATVPVLARSSVKDDDIYLQVAVVYSSGDDQDMTITGSGGGSGYQTVSFPAAVNPTLVLGSGVLTAEVGAISSLTFETNTTDNSSENDWLIIHTISVWPI